MVHNIHAVHMARGSGPETVTGGCARGALIGRVIEHFYEYDMIIYLTEA